MLDVQYLAQHDMASFSTVNGHFETTEVDSQNRPESEKK